MCSNIQVQAWEGVEQKQYILSKIKFLLSSFGSDLSVEYIDMINIMGYSVIRPDNLDIFRRLKEYSGNFSKGKFRYLTEIVFN